jgi:DNA-binding XRE family transcriptional regulator
VWEHVCDDPRTIKPVTAFEAPPPAASKQTEKAMSARRVYQKASRSAAQKAELAALREKYQRQKPSLAQALSDNDVAEPVPLGELIQLHQVMAQLKSERMRQGLTSSDVARKAGIDSAALSRLESGRNSNPTMVTIYRIASALGKVVSCHLEDAPSPAPRPTLPTRGGKKGTQLFSQK